MMSVMVHYVMTTSVSYLSSGSSLLPGFQINCREHIDQLVMQLQAELQAVGATKQLVGPVDYLQTRNTLSRCSIVAVR